MIKKNTKVIIKDGEQEQVDNLMGGMPLSKGEIVEYKKGSGVINYEVIEKRIEMFDEGEDRVVNITYILKKQ